MNAVKLSAIPLSDGPLLIEIREVYDGWSIRRNVDGSYDNRWDVDDRRYKPTQEWINAQVAHEVSEADG